MSAITNTGKSFDWLSTDPQLFAAQIPQMLETFL